MSSFRNLTRKPSLPSILRAGFAVIVVLTTILIVPNAGSGQLPRVEAKKAANPEEPKFTEAVSLPRNPESKRLIQAAQDYVKTQEWRTACECLQSLLETPEDSFIEVVRKNDKGQEVKLRVSVRSEANRIISELPADALESYQVQYGQVAAERLKEAVAQADPVLLAEVGQRYFNTKSGQEATNLLGTYHLDRGQYLMASLCFERLLARADAESLPPRVVFKAALAYRRAGHPAADRTFARFTELFNRDNRPANSRITLDHYRAEFVRDVGRDQVANAGDWPVYRGNATRTAQGRGSTAYLEPKWSASIIRPEEPPETGNLPAVQWIEQHLEQAIRLLRDKPVMPAFFPVAANGKLFVRTYDGVAAYSLKSGKDDQPGSLLWRSTADNSLFKTVRDDIKGKRNELQKWYSTYYLARDVGPVGVLFENSVLGSISHDGQRVYFIDDLAVPPHANMMRAGNPFMAVSTSYGAFSDEVHFSRLCAADIDGGKLSWAVIGGKSASKPGAPAEGGIARDSNAAIELQDSFFLGPPLPLGGKLYVLTEKQSELRLVCLDPNKQVQSPLAPSETVPELVWIQSLGTANDRLPLDSQRRMQASHLSYGDGILVCPTNAGAVIGVDLLSHSLVWAFSYRKVQTQVNPEEAVFLPRRNWNSRSPVSSERWRPSAPCVIKGKVIFTAPDSNDVHCLSLRDGQLLWSARRDDADLYLAGAFDDVALIVSKNQVRALRIDNGREAWKTPGTGIPSGQGVAAEGVYYLPLANSADPKSVDKGPEICAIDLKSGAIVGRSKSRSETPGNLMFLDGELIAQTIRTISSYPLLKVKQEEINTALARNPNDPVGLFERGELHLYNGEVRDAVADLRRALANHPPADVKARAGGKLHEAFTTIFKEDFAAAEQYLDEYAAVCQVEIAADASADAKQKLAAERLRRRAAYLELLGRGREKQGRAIDAFLAYEQYCELSGHKELVDSVDEPNTKTRPDIWSRGRIQALLSAASESDRKRIEDEIAKRLASARATGDVNSLRKFAALYGPISAAGKIARLELSERLLATNDPDDLTEAERLLAAICFSPTERRDDPSTVGRATELMIRVCVRRGRYENAVGFTRQLANEFPDTVVRDGMTGKQVLQDLMTDKRFLPYLDTPGTIWPGTLTPRRQSGNFNAMRDGTMTVRPQGNLLPFFEWHRLVLDIRQDGGPGLWSMRVVDRSTGEERWRVPNLPNGNYAYTQRFVPPAVHVTGPMMVMQFNEWVIAHDTSERKELWRFNLMGKDAQLYSDQTQMRAFEVLNNNVVSTTIDDKRIPVGRVAIVEPTYIALQGRDGLTAIDPTRPGPSRLWVKSDIPVKASVFGDSRHVLIFDRDAKPGTPKCQAIRASDGVPVPCADFAEFYRKNLLTDGGNILCSDDSNHALRLIEAISRREIWSKSYPAGSIIVKCDDQDYTGLLAPNGDLSVLEVANGKVALTCPIGAERVQKLKEATLLIDRDKCFLALMRRPEAGLNWDCPGQQWLQHLKFNGPLIAIDRKTGAFVWAQDGVPHQTILTDQWKDLPVLLCAASYARKAPNGNAEEQGVVVAAVNKSNGKLVCDEKLVVNSPIHAVLANPSVGKIEVIRQDVKIILASSDAVSAATPEKAIARPTRRVPAAAPRVPPAPRGGQ